MFKRVVILFCVFSLISFISCKNKNGADGAEAAFEAAIDAIYDGGESGDSDYLGDDNSESEICNNNGTCDEGETAENCRADCAEAGGKSNAPTTASIKLVPNANEYTIKELDSYNKFDGGLEVKIKNYEGIVIFSEPVVSCEKSSDSIEIIENTEIGFDDDENRIKYSITGVSVDRCEVTFSATSSENAEETFSKMVTFVVAENMLKNNSSIGGSSGIEVGKTLTLNRVSRDGSENHSWEKVAVAKKTDAVWNDAEEGLDYRIESSETLEPSGKDVTHIEDTLVFLKVGNYKITTMVVDGELDYKAPSNDMIVKATENVNFDIFTVTEGNVNDCLSDTNCRKKLEDGKVEYGKVLVVQVEGDDEYSCEAAEGFSESLTLTEAFDYNNNLICVISVDEDVDYDSANNPFKNQSISIVGQISGSTVAFRRDLTFLGDPCQKEVKIRGLDGETLTREFNISLTDEKSFKFRINEACSGGYDVDVELVGTQDQTIRQGGAQADGGQWEQRFDPFSCTVEAVSGDNCQSEDGFNLCYELTASYDGVIDGENVQKQCMLKIKNNSCSNPDEKDFTYNLETPTPETAGVTGMRMKIGISWDHINDYCLARFELLDGSKRVLGYVNGYAVDHAFKLDNHGGSTANVEIGGEIVWIDAEYKKMKKPPNLKLSDVVYVKGTFIDDGTAWTDMDVKIHYFITYTSNFYSFVGKGKDWGYEIDGNQEADDWQMYGNRVGSYTVPWTLRPEPGHSVNITNGEENGDISDGSWGDTDAWDAIDWLWD